MDIATKAKSGRFDVVIKSTTKDTNAPFGSFEAILSVPTLDRDGEVVDAKCFDPLPDHITIDVDHAMTVEKTVASGRPFYDGEVLKFAGTYASHPLAQMTRSLVDEGHIRTMSVAYMNGVYELDEKDGLPHLRSAELLNAGIVGIPSNREALITASKSLRRQWADMELKAVVGSYEARTEQVRQTLRESYPLAEWVWVRATFDDQVVFDIETANGCGTYQASYTVSDTGIVITDPVEVDLAEVVVPPMKAAKPSEISTETNPETKAAAAADAAAAAEPLAAVNVVAMAQARALAAEAELALL